VRDQTIGENVQTFQKYNPPPAARSFPNEVPETQTHPDAYHLFLFTEGKSERMPPRHPKRDMCAAAELFFLRLNDFRFADCTQGRRKNIQHPKGCDYNKIQPRNFL